MFEKKPPTTHWEKFKEWMKFNPPSAATWDGWDDFKKEYKAGAPIRYFIVETVPDAISSFFSPVTYRWQKLREYFRYRCIPRRRYHVVQTGLKPDYYEFGTRMLHANFNMLVMFVEQEKANMQMWCNSDTEPRPNGWWWKKYTNWRDAEAGMKYLVWETTLDSDKWDGVSRPTQAQRAREVIVLYKWWTEEYMDPESLDYPESPAEDTGTSIFSDKFDRTTPEYIAWQKECRELEERQEKIKQESTAMLARLAVISDDLWT